MDLVHDVNIDDRRDYVIWAMDKSKEFLYKITVWVSDFRTMSQQRSWCHLVGPARDSP